MSAHSDRPWGIPTRTKRSTKRATVALSLLSLALRDPRVSPLRRLRARRSRERETVEQRERVLLWCVVCMVGLQLYCAALRAAAGTRKCALRVRNLHEICSGEPAKRKKKLLTHIKRNSHLPQVSASFISDGVSHRWMSYSIGRVASRPRLVTFPRDHAPGPPALWGGSRRETHACRSAPTRSLPTACRSVMCGVTAAVGIVDVNHR